MKKPIRSAQKIIGIMIQIAIFALVVIELACGGVNDTVTELVFDAVATMLGRDVVVALLGLNLVVALSGLDVVVALLTLDAGDTAPLVAAETEKFGDKISMSVLCHRTCTLYAFIPSPGSKDEAATVVLPPAESVTMMIPLSVKLEVHDSVACHGYPENGRQTKLLDE